MNYLLDNIYREYRFSMGDADIVFFSNHDSLSESPDTGLPHSHKLYELFHILEGSMTILTDSAEYSIKQEDTIIVAPETTHCLRVPAGTKRLCMIFAIEKNPTVPSSGSYDGFLNVFSEDITRFHSSHLITGFQRCAKYIENDYPEKDELISACLHEIMALMKTTSAQQEEGSPAESISHTQSSRTYLIDHYFTNNFQNGSLTELAGLLHLSSQQTQRVIKKMYGQSFSERLTMMKMQLAKTLLQETKLSITQISEKCGYTGPNGFFVAFKKYYGSTPNRLKNQIDKS